MKILVNGIELFYEISGQGRPLILVHGNGEDHHIFDALVAKLKNHYTCYCIDSRGHGLSSSVAVYSYQSMAEDIIEFIKSLKLSEVAYYGFSDGGIVGLLVASQSKLIKYLMISGANADPDGLKNWAYYLMKIQYYLKKDVKITAKTLILVGSDDMIKESHTLYLAHNISGSQLMILPNENHSSYIINSAKLAPIILAFLKVA